MKSQSGRLRDSVCVVPPRRGESTSVFRTQSWWRAWATRPTLLFTGFLMRRRRGEAVKSVYEELTPEASHLKEGFYYKRMKR
jgi:hypothetical protein